MIVGSRFCLTLFLRALNAHIFELSIRSPVAFLSCQRFKAQAAIKALMLGRSLAVNSAHGVNVFGVHAFSFPIAEFASLVASWN